MAEQGRARGQGPDPFVGARARRARNVFVVALVLCGGLLCGCVRSGITYHRDVAPILESRCLSCHQAGLRGGVEFSSFASAHAASAAIKAAVVSRRMPEWFPDETVRAMQHSRRLSDEEIDVISDWVDSGAAEGDPSQHVPGTDRQSIRVDREVAMPARYLPLQDVTDDNHCFLLDPGFTEATALTGVDFRSDGQGIVHHISVDAVSAEDAWRFQEKQDREGNGFRCGEGNGPTVWTIGAGPPGSPPTRYPPGTAMLLPAGTKFVLDVHYNTLQGKGLTDRSTVLLELAEPTAGLKNGFFGQSEDVEIDIPPGELKTTVAELGWNGFDMKSLERIDLGGLMPHMHLHGVAFRATLLQDGQSIPLIDMPGWNFHGQQVYFFKEPVEFHTGGVIRMECVHDNRASAQPLINGVRREPTRLHLGPGTLDEMCSLSLWGTP